MPDRDKKTGRFISSAKAKAVTMTNAEFFEKYNVPFAKAMKLFNRQKSKTGGTKSFDKFLASESFKHKFKIGDIVVVQLNDYTISIGWKHNVVLKIEDFAPDRPSYFVNFLTPAELVNIGHRQYFTFDFIDKNCIKY